MQDKAVAGCCIYADLAILSPRGNLVGLVYLYNKRNMNVLAQRRMLASRDALRQSVPRATGEAVCASGDVSLLIRRLIRLSCSFWAAESSKGLA